MGKTAQQESPWDVTQAILAYRETHDLSLRNDLVIHYSYIAKAVALQMRSIASSYAQVEDMIHQGLLTLIDCIERFDPHKGVKFESYAFTRIKNANIDFIRKQDWVPRRVRKAAKDLMNAYDQLWGQLLREPTAIELAQHMGMSEDELNHSYGEIAGTVMLSFEALLQSSAVGGDFTPGEQYIDRESVPESQVLHEELREQLAQAIDNLTEREKLVVSLYYQEQLRFHEIAKVLSVSESRVCQIHGKAILKLKKHMQAYQKGNPTSGAK